MNDCVGWLDSFNMQYPDFIKKSPVKLQFIQNLYSREMGNAAGIYEYDENKPVPSGIYLNAKYHFDLNLFQMIVTEQIENNVWIANAVLHKSFVHEFGHHISNSLRWIIKNLDWESEFIQKCVDELKTIAPTYSYNTYTGLTYYLSEYGASKTGECFAEAFAEYYGGRNPRQFAKIFGKNLDKILKEVKL